MRLEAWVGREQELTKFLLLLSGVQVSGSVKGCGGDGRNCGQQISKPNIEKPVGQSPESLTEFKQLNNKLREPGSVAANFIRFIGLTDSKSLDRSCCNNGGTCILGSFCACPPPFVGRYCERDERLKMCDKTPENEWVLKQCTWCKCGNGRFQCAKHLGRIEKCDPGQEDDFFNRYSVLIGGGSRLVVTLYLLLSALCFVGIVEL
ncbi:cryptic protein-like [Leucoraja erinacea]|uniref:cryptic protein-like n=1 Tax=Leucoraja erinaceus TaxID=7782 RepID=UPI002454F2A5|nr:cryptic protein-like [Leucoraja erinacea]